MAETVIDVHIHVGGPGGAKDDDQSGCAWSEDFENTEAFVAFMLSSGTSYERLTQSHIRKKVLKTIGTSGVDLGVLLALVLPSVASALKLFYGVLTAALFMPLMVGLLSARPGAAHAPDPGRRPSPPRPTGR